MEAQRKANIERNTTETQISMSLNLDGSGKAVVDTGIPFFDHMLVLFAHHGRFDLDLKATGDLGVDYHHTVEDVGIVLGECLRQALGNKAGIRRYGFFLLPMDECLCRFVLDLGGRPHLVYRVDPAQSFVRDFNIILVREFFQAFANSAAANVHVGLLYGDEPHHVAESIFKAFGRALNVSVSQDPQLRGEIDSTKGTLA